MKIKLLIIVLLSIAIIFLVGVSLMQSSCSNGQYVEDNPIEEYLEDIIEEETGLDIDLSPFSRED